MTSRQTCARCQKTLTPGLGPDGPLHFAMTGETICGDCMMLMLAAASPAVDDNAEVKEFRRAATQELARSTGVKESSISIHCKQFISHDVEITIENQRYEIVLIYDLITDRPRWRQS